MRRATYAADMAFRSTECADALTAASRADERKPVAILAGFTIVMPIAFLTPLAFVEVRLSSSILKLRISIDTAALLAPYKARVGAGTSAATDDSTATRGDVEARSRLTQAAVTMRGERTFSL